LQECGTHRRRRHAGADECYVCSRLLHTGTALQSQRSAYLRVPVCVMVHCNLRQMPLWFQAALRCQHVEAGIEKTLLGVSGGFRVLRRLL
jgi:hypothetical protein